MITTDEVIRHPILYCPNQTWSILTGAQKPTSPGDLLELDDDAVDPRYCAN